MRLIGQHWRIITSVLLSLLILVVAFLNRNWLLEAFAEVQAANPVLLFASLALILLGYFITSQVLQVALRSMKYRFSFFRTWAIALVAVVISQSVPAGGVGSYAFLVGIFTRRGVQSGKSTLVASLETLSYVSAMLLIFMFSLLFLSIRGLASLSIQSYAAAVVAFSVVGGVTFVLTRSTEKLTRWLMGLKNWLARLLRRSWGDEWVHHTVGELARGRSLLASRPRDMIGLVIIQVGGLLSHSLALMMVLWSLGVETSFFTVVIAFSVGLITSTFNVLPGGGGTVEFALIAILAQQGAGAAAVPAAIIFRLLNFWLLLPVAATCYYWLMHESPVRESDTPDSQQDNKDQDTSGVAHFSPPSD